jgi:hypothetical protein
MNAYTTNSGNDDSFDSKGIALATILICLVLLLGPLVMQLLIILAFKLDDVSDKNTRKAKNYSTNQTSHKCPEPRNI